MYVSAADEIGSLLATLFAKASSGRVDKDSSEIMPASFTNSGSSQFLKILTKLCP